MRRGPRHLPMRPRGHRRIGVLAVGIVAALSLVWQQQATLASYADAEYGTVTFTAATLTAITPDATANAASVDVSWTAPSRAWATPQYRLDGSTGASGIDARKIYSGPATRATHDTASVGPSSRELDFTAVAAGATHACGIARGSVYCWGTSTPGGLGLGTATRAKVPTPITAGDLAGRTVTALVAGTDFTCALAERRVYCWGEGGNGQLGNGAQADQDAPTAVSSLTGVTSLSAGTAHACAVAGGKAYCWGQGASGQLGDAGTSQKESPTAVKTDGVLDGRTVASVAAGGSHSCAVADGKAFCWGLNDDGQLGDRTTTARSVPAAVETNGMLMARTVSSVTAGANHTCAIADGKAFCWGRGTSGQLGNSGSATSAVPVAVTPTAMSSPVTELAAGRSDSCAITAGNVYCWGRGVGTQPVAVGGTTAGRTVTAISLGTDFGCAIAVNAPAACAGVNADYQLGNGTTTTSNGFVDVALSGPLCPDGSVRTSATTCSLVQGTDYFYRLGYDIGSWNAPDSAWVKATTATRRGLEPSNTGGTRSVRLTWDAPREPGDSYAQYVLERRKDSSDTAVKLAVTGDTAWSDLGGLKPSRDFTQVSTGAAHSCGIVSGTLYCWGRNDKGQLGTGTSTSVAAPALVMSGVAALSAGGSHTCALDNAGAAYCWGDNSSGQLGVNSASPRAETPQRVAGGLTFAAISAGTTHTCGVTTGGLAYCWGANSSGQLGLDSTTASSAPAKVVNTFKNNGGKALEFENIGVTTIAAGGSHTCATNAGGAWCWGADSDGQLGDGNDTQNGSPVAVPVQRSNNHKLNNVLGVTVGTSHSCATTTSGAAYCWGSDNAGQLGDDPAFVSQEYAVPVGGNLTNVTLLEAGSNHTCAAAAAAAYCWGDDASRQLGRGDTSTASSGTPVAVSLSGALAGRAVTSISAGGSQSCLVVDGGASCWGLASDGRLGLGGSVPDASSYGYPQLVLGDVRCASGSVALGDGTCSLVSAATYQYRVTFTLDGNTRTPGAWTSITVG